MPLQNETVAIAFSSGIQPVTRARLLNPEKLLRAENCYFLQDQGPQKRSGHVSRVVRTSADFVGLNGIVPPTPAPSKPNFSFADPTLAASWLYGWGIYSPTQLDSANPYSVSPQTTVGQLFGITQRDNEVVSWDGHRLFSYAPNQSSRFGETQNGIAATSTRGPVTMPALRAQTIAKVSDSQLLPDAADNGVLRVVAWLTSDGTSVQYSAYDSTNKAAIVSAATITMQAPKSVRVISQGGWFHIIASDTTANSLEMRSFNQETPNTLVARSFGTTDVTFDVKKIDETGFIIGRCKTGVLTIYVLSASGSTVTSFVPNLGGFPIAGNCGFALETDISKNIGLLWRASSAPDLIKFCLYNQAGLVIGSIVSVTTASVTPRRLTLSPRVMLTPAGVRQGWDAFVEDFVSSISQVRTYYIDPGTGATLMATRHRAGLASHAFRVGNRNFVWMGTDSTVVLQKTWFLCDSGLLPVGKMDFGQANVEAVGTTSCLPSVNWHITTQGFKDRIVFHGALPYNQRVTSNSSSVSPNGVFAETSIRFYELDFLPQMRAAQAGRATYFSGAQLWSFDGSEAVEGVFHLAPEGVTGVNTAGGSLSAGTYRYRVDLCHKNAQSEEVRSWSVITSAIVASASDKITVTIPHVPFTRREDSYFLIFRTEANGGVYYLANSRDPISANYVKNNPASPTFTFVDTTSDAIIRAREYHPANAQGNYLDPLPAPASELVVAGRDRLWLSGGELNPGELAPSRLFPVGTTPAFSPALNIQVDRNAEPITAVGFVGDLTAIFRRTSIYVLDSDGPDNSLSQAWPSPRLTVADTGAISQDGLVLSVVGLWFLSPAGIRKLNNGGAMDTKAGYDMDPLAKTSNLCASMVIPQFTQVRWYSRDATQPALVYNYLTDSWCTWTGLTCTGAVFWQPSSLAILSKGDGYIWVEDDSVFTDAGLPYEMVIRVAWLHGGQLGDFQRIRRIGLFGSITMPTAPETLKLRMRLFYDERPFYDEEIVREIPQTTSDGLWNVSTWGGNAKWGTSGTSEPWGDNVQ